MVSPQGRPPWFVGLEPEVDGAGSVHAWRVAPPDGDDDLDDST